MKFKFLNKKKLVVILLSSIAITNFTACNKKDDNIDVVINIENYDEITTNNSENTVINNTSTVLEDNNTVNNIENKNQNDNKNNNLQNEVQNNITTDEVEDQKFNITKEDVKNEILEILEDDKEFLYDIKNFITQGYSENDEIIINELQNIQNEINEIKEDDKEFLCDIKSNFITCVDFVFCGTEINGVKFNDLTQKGKQKVLELISTIDNSIENKYPNYKNEISEGTNDILNKLINLIKEGAVNIDNFTKTKLTEEEYKNLINAKNNFLSFSKGAFENIKDSSIELYEEGKQKVIEFYNN